MGTDMMNEFQAVLPKTLGENFIELIGDDWMLVTAGDSSKFNMMTASWGGAGYLWNKPVVFVFVRPQRYTYEFMEDKRDFTLSFLDEKYRNALKICGTESGRDIDKVHRTGLTPCFSETGNVAFKEARLVLECRKLYCQFLEPGAFLDESIVTKHYPEHDYHKVYVAEIVKAWKK